MANSGRFTTKKIDTTLSARALYGAELRYYRELRSLTLAELAHRLHIEMSFLARIEQGERRLTPELAVVVDDLLSTGGFFVRHLAAGRSVASSDAPTLVADWERLALTIREWDAVLVPGLLQTDAYAAAVADVYAPLLADRTHRRRWEARLSRTPVLFDSEGPRYTAVLGETVMRRPLGGPSAMAAQLGRIAELMRHRRIVVHVLPLIATPHPSATEGALRLMTFPDEMPTAHFAAHQVGTRAGDPATAALAHLSFDLLRAAALDPDASLGVIETATGKYREQAAKQRVSHASNASADLSVARRPARATGSVRTRCELSVDYG